MTYCVAISVKSGIVFCSDSLTSAGVDQVSTYSKMFRFGRDGERQFVILSAGNLATTQAAMSKVKADIDKGAPRSLMNVADMGEAAEYLGQINLEQQAKRANENKSFEASFIIGGQIKGGPHRIALVYPEGNFITTSEDTPFLQIGESKYGKPILDRILTSGLDLNTCALSALVSMDSTMRSNLSVGPPVEVLIYQTDSLNSDSYHRFDDGSDYLKVIHDRWDEHLKQAFRQMPPLPWADNWDKHSVSGES